MVSKDFQSVFKKIQRTVNGSSNQALNRALTSTKSQYARLVGADLGITQSRIKARAKIIKVNSNNVVGTLSIGTRVKFAAQDFKPGDKKVQSNRGTRRTATYVIKTSGKVAIDGAFLAIATSGKKLILMRDGSDRYPTKTVLLDIFAKSVEANKQKLQSHLRATFESVFRSVLAFNLTK